MAKTVQNTMRMSAKAFMVLCVIDGTDYHDKPYLVRGIAGRDLIAMLSSDKGVVLLEKVCVPSTYITKWTESWGELSAYVVDKPDHGVKDCLALIKESRAFKSDDIEIGIDNMLWNLQYWAFPWNSIVISPPLSL
jgi:hypothetical protein